MSSTDIFAAALNGAARGHLIGSARAANQRANSLVEKSNNYKAQAIAYASMMLEAEDKVEEQAKLIAEYEKAYNHYKEAYERVNQCLKEMNVTNSASISDRRAAYQLIEQMSAVIRELSPHHPVLSNPNAVAAKIQDGSRKTIEDKFTLFKGGTDKRFSINHDQAEFESAIDIRIRRGATFKQAAVNGETKLVDPDQYGSKP